MTGANSQDCSGEAFHLTELRDCSLRPKAWCPAGYLPLSWNVPELLSVAE